MNRSVFGKMPINSLFSWQGGKFYESKRIIDLIPKHEWYCEVFAGSIVLLINKPQSKFEFANDKFSCLVNFWKCVKNSRMAKKLISLIEETLDSKFDYEWYMKQDPEQLSRIDRAYRFMYLTSFGFNSYLDTWYSPLTHTIGSLKEWSERFFKIGKRLWSIHERIKNVKFSNYDFREFLQKVKPHSELFLLLDPPYINTHGYNRGIDENLAFPEEWYIDMRNELLRHHEGESKFMITCNQENTYFDEMPDIIVKNIERRTTMNKNKEKRPVKTKIVMNYDINDCRSVWELEQQEQVGNFVML